MMFPIVFFRNIIHREESERDLEKYVPDAILSEKYQNRQIQEGQPKIYKEGNCKVKEYPCGCKFKDRVDSFGYENSWCDKHAPSQPFVLPNYGTVSERNEK